MTYKKGFYKDSDDGKKLDFLSTDPDGTPGKLMSIYKEYEVSMKDKILRPSKYVKNKETGIVQPWTNGSQYLGDILVNCDEFGNTDSSCYEIDESLLTETNTVNVYQYNYTQGLRVSDEIDFSSIDKDLAYLESRL